VRTRLGGLFIVFGVAKWVLDAWGRWDALKELASQFPKASRFLGEPWVTPTIIVVGVGVLVWAGLDRGGTVGFDDLRFLPERYRQKRVPHEYIVGGAILLILVLFGFVMHNRGAATVKKHPMEWAVFGNNYGPLENSENYWSGIAVSPQESISTPITLKLTFTGEILGEPTFEYFAPSSKEVTKPISLSILKHEGKTVTLKILDPPFESNTALYVRAVSVKPVSIVRVSCVVCPYK
jgi:hypothetical protein